MSHHYSGSDWGFPLGDARLDLTAQFTDLSLLLLRLMAAAVFVTSGWSDVKDPKERAKSIGKQ